MPDNLLATMLRDSQPHRVRAALILRRLACAARAWPVPALLWATVAVSAFFLLFPGFDVWFSGLYYDPATGFAAERDPFLMRLRELGPFLVWLIALGSLALLLARLLGAEMPKIVPTRAPLFLLATLALGPGLLVNGILKQWSGRPRPRYLEVFGGDMPYIPVWRFTDLCPDNCSFVSGEGSSGAWLVALTLVLPLAWRRPAVYVAVAIGASLALNRVAFGGHFLSDTLLAWCLTGLLIALLHRLFYRHTPGWLQEHALDSRLASLGAWLRARAEEIGFRLRAQWRARRR